MLAQRLVRRSRKILRKTGIDGALLPPRYPGLRLTLKRLLNLYLVRYQRARGHTKLWGYPLVLTLESGNVCNLRCPACFTGVGEVGRERSMMPMPLYRKIMDELGDYALHVEFYNWGEPLLNKNIYEMIRIANDKGISTILSTNFSVPFDRARAEALVSSGLALLGFGLDGATQENYEKYRVGGDFEKVLHNVRLLNEAKRALASTTPRICWSFHIFPHNTHEIEPARAMADELGVEFAATKGWIAGPEWEPNGEFRFPAQVPPEANRCKYLWTYAIINNDGRAAPCSASFYQEDDYGAIEDLSFKEVWNNKNFQEARRLYRSRDASQHGKSLICHNCPQTIVWENHQRHLAQGLPKASFDPVYTTNDWFNYFFNRKPDRARAASAADIIDLQPVGHKSRALRSEPSRPSRAAASPRRSRG